MLKGLLLAILIMVGISLIPLKIYFRFYRKKNDFRLTVLLKIWKIPFVFRINNLVTKFFWSLSENRFWQKKTPQELRASEIAWYRVFSRLYNYQQIFRSTLQETIAVIRKLGKPIIIRKIRLNSEVALQDAAQTAFAVGILWWYWGFIYSQIVRYFKIAKNAIKNLSINPDYQKQNEFTIDFSCILEFPLGHIIIIIYYLFTNAGKIRIIFRRVSQ